MKHHGGKLGRGKVNLKEVRSKIAAVSKSAALKKKTFWDEKAFGPKDKHDKAVARGKAEEKYGSYGPNPNRK